MAEKMESVLQDFESKRDLYNQNLMNLRDEIIDVINNLFGNLVREMDPIIEETDREIEIQIKEFKRLTQRKKEINDIREKLSPVIEVLSKSS